MNELAFFRQADGLYLVRRRVIGNVHVLHDPNTGKRMICEVNHKIKPMFVSDMAGWIDTEEGGDHDDEGIIKRTWTRFVHRIAGRQLPVHGPSMVRFFHRIHNGIVEQPMGALEESAERITAHFVDMAVRTGPEGKPEVNVDGMEDVQEAMDTYGVNAKEQMNYVNFLVMTQKFQHRLNFFVESILERLNPAAMAMSLVFGAFLFGIFFGVDISARTGFLKLYKSSNWYYAILGLSSVGLIAWGLRRRT